MDAQVAEILTHVVKVGFDPSSQDRARAAQILRFPGIVEAALIAQIGVTCHVVPPFIAEVVEPEGGGRQVRHYVVVVCHTLILPWRVQRVDIVSPGLVASARRAIGIEDYLFNGEEVKLLDLHSREGCQCRTERMSGNHYLG
jgi:hypothetical protein